MSKDKTLDENNNNIFLSSYLKGRVYINKTLANKIELKDGDNVAVYVDDDKIIIKKIDKVAISKFVR